MSRRKCCYEQPRDFSALRGRIKEKYAHEYELAAELGLTKQAFSCKLHSFSAFTVSEIVRICELLDIPTAELDAYFRTPLIMKVQPKGIRDAIKEKCRTEAALARKIGMKRSKLCHRLNFQVDFRYSELVSIAEALELPVAQVVELLEVERRKADEQKAQSD